MRLYEFVYEEERRKPERRRDFRSSLSARSFGKWLFPSTGLGSRMLSGHLYVWAVYYYLTLYTATTVIFPLFFRLLREKRLAGRRMLDNSLLQETLQHNENAVNLGQPNSTGCVCRSIATYLYQLHMHGRVVAC